MAANLPLTIPYPYATPTFHRRRRYVAWAAQVALAVLFVFAGAMKFIMSADDMGDTFPLAFLRFIGVCELLGGLGLILPGVLNIRRGLTPIAGAGLVIIMAGAVVTTVATMGPLPALFPLAIGLVAAGIVRARWAWLAGK